MDCSTVWMLDITAFGPDIGSPLTAFFATLSTIRIEVSTVPDPTEHVGTLEPSAATDGMGKQGWMCPMNCFISRSNQELTCLGLQYNWEQLSQLGTSAQN